MGWLADRCRRQASAHIDLSVDEIV